MPPLKLAIVFILFIILILTICFIISNTHYDYKYGGSYTKSPHGKNHYSKNQSLHSKTNHLKNQSLHYSKKQPLRSESDVYASDRSESDVYASDSSDSDVYASDSSESNVYASDGDVYAMTYTISGEGNGLDYSQLRKILQECISNGIQFVEKPVTEKVHISFGTFGDFMVNGKLFKKWHYDPAFFTQKTAIKNTLGNSNHLINKSQLYDTIKKLIPNGIKYLPKNYTNKEIEISFPKDITLILKKDHSEKQKGVIIVHSKKEYYDAKETLRKFELERANIKKVKPSYGMMISEYITNPLLIEGKKFHLRVYFLLSVISGITRCSFYKQYRILTAKLPYIVGNWLNDKIHLSGGHNTEKLYNYPEDLQKEYPNHFHTIENNLNTCNKVIAMAMTIANIQHFSESYTGYHIYGLDIMITDDYHPYLLEINSKPGFGEYGNHIDWDKYNKYFSNQFFSFILNQMAFPLFGITRPPIYDAEFIGDGTLTPFAPILTGANKCIFIPYLDATELEIAKVKQIHFFSNDAILDKCLPINIFLISQLTSIEKNNIVIGFLALDKNNYLQVAIIEEFQNRGIATAMVAQFLEIYRMRHFTLLAIKPIYINRNNIFIVAIAKKLHFIKNKNNHYEYVITKSDTHNSQNNTITKHKFLTYKIIYENKKNNHIDLVDSKYMTESNSQFVSFVYNLLHNITIIKHSTGNKHSKNFIYQGAELKSTLDIKILFGLFLIKLWSYKNNSNKEYDIFDKRIKNKNELALKQKYTIYDANNRNYMILDSNDIKEEYYDINNYYIEEYNPPYLLDGKLMYIIYYIVVYISQNGVIKFYIFSKNKILTPKNAYTEDLNNVNEMAPKYIDSQKYDIDSILDICTSYESLYPIIMEFLKILVEYEIKPYPESNSGFLEFPILIKYIKIGEKYKPVIGKIDNTVTIYENNILDSDFVNEYYKWIKDCIILPHFGIANHKNVIHPNYGALSKYVQYTSKKIQYSIIEKIHLEFNLEKNDVDIYYGDRMQSMQSIQPMQSIGGIKLHTKENEIYVTSIPVIKEENVEINIIFALMELLRAYYAPIQMFLLLKYEKKMNDIAFELEFAKKGDYYIKAIT